ncbi:hypothetical protein V6N12_044239 [Hibiscus sabdariffa]|uniref:YbaK/aminoacyl-tRNA synthetase-associated domain-containing protein n=1 Tax=Hibiscus sabdariffa TaxID=183260 RepID=A0ABR2DJM2_9ROSI
MEATLAELERVQTRILERILKLELSHLPPNAEHISSSSPPTIGDASADVEARLSNILRSNGVNDFIFKRVASDYYDWPLESRRDALGAASVHHLCKSIVLEKPTLDSNSERKRVAWYSRMTIPTTLYGGAPSPPSGDGWRLTTATRWLVMVNTQAPSNVIDCSDWNNSKNYVVVVQYTARFNAETVKNFLYTVNNGKISKKKFNLRLAPEETSIKLTGYEHNAVTCIGMQTDIPVILDEAIVKLNPGFFWLGGGEVDLKLGIRTSEFISFVKPFIVSCSGDCALRTVVLPTAGSALSINTLLIQYGGSLVNPRCVF